MFKNMIFKIKVKKALKIALKNFSKDTIIEIMTYENGGWANGAELLNEVSPEYAKSILDDM